MLHIIITDIYTTITTNAAPSLHHKTTIPTIRTTITSTVTTNTINKTTNTTPDPRDSTNTHHLHQHHKHHNHHHHQHINNNNNNESSRPMWSNTKIVQLDITIVIDIYWLKLLTRHNVINIIS